MQKIKEEKGDILEIFMISSFIALLTFVFVIIGVAVKQDMDYGVKEGTVTDKQYHAGYTTYIYSGKVMFPSYHPEGWSLKIEKENKSIWITVDQVTYHNYEIGSYYP